MKLTPKQEDFCKYIEIEKLSQYEAYLKAYPAAQSWKRSAMKARTRPAASCMRSCSACSASAAAVWAR